MVKQTGVLGRHVGPLNTAGILLKGKSCGLHICLLYPDSSSMLSKCCSSDMLVSDNEWCPASRPLHNFTAIREIAITLAFPIQLSQNDPLLLVNQLHPTAHQPTCASTGCCVTSLHPLLRAPSYSDCTCRTKCTLCFFLQRPLFLIAELQRFQLCGMSHNMQKMRRSSWRR